MTWLMEPLIIEECTGIVGWLMYIPFKPWPFFLSVLFQMIRCNTKAVYLTGSTVCTSSFAQTRNSPQAWVRLAGPCQLLRRGPLRFWCWGPLGCTHSGLSRKRRPEILISAGLYQISRKDGWNIKLSLNNPLKTSPLQLPCIKFVFQIGNSFSPNKLHAFWVYSFLCDACNLR